ncbi:PglZ domain-containing protein, partial [bacterium]|nr:PglZ domain-containing protein [bacterium]
ILVVVDCMRVDQWRILEPTLTSLFDVETTHYFAVLPTATPYSRNALFSGLFPGEIAARFPDWWGERDDETLNAHERDLLEAQMRELRISVPVRYHKISTPHDSEELERHMSTAISPEGISAFVFNFVDLLTHGRSESAILFEVAKDEIALRQLTLQWFQRSSLLSLPLSSRSSLASSSAHSWLACRASFQPSPCACSFAICASSHSQLASGGSCCARQPAFTACLAFFHSVPSCARHCSASPNSRQSGAAASRSVRSWARSTVLAAASSLASSSSSLSSCPRPAAPAPALSCRPPFCPPLFGAPAPPPPVALPPFPHLAALLLLPLAAPLPASVLCWLAALLRLLLTLPCRGPVLPSRRGVLPPLAAPPLLLRPLLVP